MQNSFLRSDLNNKEELLNIVADIQTDLDKIQSGTDLIKRAIENFDLRPSSGLNLVDSAFAQTSTRVVIPVDIKVAFAIAAFGLLAMLMVYCLWMIARSSVSQTDKKWAKELLNRELVFLGGVIGGIVVKWPIIP